MKPIDMVPTKLIEKAPLLYFFVTGCLFIAVPSTLNAPIYAHWSILSAREWGTVLLIICALHTSALWWNGRNALISRVMRASALIGYSYISILWGLNFVLAGAYWGAVLFWVLLPVLCSSIYLRIVSDVKAIRKAQNA